MAKNKNKPKKVGKITVRTIGKNSKGADLREKRVLRRIRNLVSTLHNDEKQKKVKDEAREKLDQALSNIRIGSLVQTNCDLLINIFLPDVAKQNASNGIPNNSYTISMSQSIDRFLKNNTMMFMGFKLISGDIDLDTGEHGKSRYQIKHVWIVNNKVLYADIHPMHFKLVKQGTGQLWEEARDQIISETMKKVRKLKKNGKEAQLTIKDYEDMVNFWAGDHTGNPARIDAILAT